ncbi:hypothetical protein BMT54_01305 [Pasteurellaceae bacterium 15-036681]|nr:hypothetical protein BMT54_01305 [Pasteurellaceae bacterium 15-036681]
MSKRNGKRQDVNNKLEQILALAESINEKVDLQNTEIEELRRQVAATNKLVDEMARKHRKQAFTAGLAGGGLGGALIATGFELMRMRFGG